MSTKKDWFVVIHMEEPERDLLFDVGITGREKVTFYMHESNLNGVLIGPLVFGVCLRFGRCLQEFDGKDPADLFHRSVSIWREFELI